MATRPVTRQRKRGVPVARLRRAPAATALTSFDDIRKIAHALPGVVDGTSYGTPALKVGGKLFARLHQRMDCVVLRSDLLDREILVQSASRCVLHNRSLPGLSVDRVAHRCSGEARLARPDRTCLALSRVENFDQEARPRALSRLSHVTRRPG
jgi:hypothetical protein